MELDIAIRGGTVADGSGNPAYRGDVGIRDGRIVAIEDRLGRAAQDIDAEGHVVTPGFIDGHTHMDAQLSWDRLGEPSCFHGITTALMGNCGFTVAPVRRGEEALVVRNLERAEAIPRELLEAGVGWEWETFPEYLDFVARREKAINYGVYVGHSALRTFVMGERAYSEAAADADLDQLGASVVEAMHAGAIGFSTSLSRHHETADDRPVASRQASWAEIRRLVGAMAQAGGGIFQLALSGEARSPDPHVKEEFFGRLRALAVDTGVAVTHGVIAATEDGSDWRTQLQWLDDANREGGRAFGQSHSRGVAVLYSFETQLPFDRLPEWHELRAQPLAEQQRRLLDRRERDRLVAAAKQMTIQRGVGADGVPPDYASMTVLRSTVSRNPTVAELAAVRRIDPVEMIIDAALESDLRQFFVQPAFPTTEGDLLTIMRHPHTVMTFSDAGAHVSQIMDASIQTYLLAHWVREQQAFTFEDAIRMLTSVPAAHWNLADRGSVACGMVADLNVIDPATVGPALPEARRDLPGGAVRLAQKSVGIRATITGGQVTVVDATATGALPGRLVRGMATRPQVFES